MINPVSKLLRFANLIIDVLLVKIVLIQMMFIPFLVSYVPEIFKNSYQSIVLLLINASVLFIYYFVLEASVGMTIAKVITRTKVADINGAKPTTYQIFIRTIIRLIPLEPFTFFGADGWHDKSSQTIVINSSTMYNSRMPLPSIKIKTQIENKQRYAHIKNKFTSSEGEQ